MPKPGAAHHNAKLTTEQVKEMRSLRAINRHRYTYLALANQFGCGESTARDIVNFMTRIAA